MRETLIAILSTMAVAAAASFGLDGCSERCCDCSASEIYHRDVCEGSLPAGFTSWEACSSALEEGGCKCS